MYDFFGSIGYSCIKKNIPTPWKRTTASCYVFSVPSSEKSIMITESTTQSVLMVVLDGKNTLSMNAITANRLYSFYPVFTSKGRAYSTFYLAENIHKDAAANWGIVLNNPEEVHFDSPCGLECPFIRRRVRGLRGIGLVRWNNDEGQKKSIDLEEQPIMWTIGATCSNPYCPHLQEYYRDGFGGIN